MFYLFVLSDTYDFNMHKFSIMFIVVESFLYLFTYSDVLKI
jgi:hypothetical protein